MRPHTATAASSPSRRSIPRPDVDTFAQLLRDGLRLARLRRPQRTPLDAGFGSFAIFFLAGLLLDAVWQWALVEAPRTIDTDGLQTAMAAGLIRLASAALLTAGSGRRRLFWAVAAWLECAYLVVTLVTGALYVVDREVDFPLGFYAWMLTVTWILLILLRLASFLVGKSVLRAAAVAILAFGLLVGPWLVFDARDLWRTEATADFMQAQAPGTLAEPEAAMYAQLPLLDGALARLAPQRPGVIDLYALAFGGDAGEDVFRNEVEFFVRLFTQRFDAGDRVLALLNHSDTASRLPLASATNLERALRGIAQRMDVEEDILFLYLTSHGSEDHWIYVNQPPLPLDHIDPKRLREALDVSGIRWRVLVISACYSGGYVDSLRDPRTLVVTASRTDRSSFGCGTDSDITWFGNAYLAHALNQTADFVAAFDIARRLVSAWESEEDFPASQPQLVQGEEIGAKLKAWRASLASGAPVEFAPAVDSPIAEE